MRTALAPAGLFALLLAAATCRDGQEPRAPAPAIPCAELPADFADRAFRHVARLCSLGPRYPGSPGHAQAIDYIRRELRRAGLEPELDRFAVPQEKLVLTNIAATIPGRSSDRILIACHHDTKRFEGHADPDQNFFFVGANDSASGIGLLLALAPVLAARENHATIQLVFFDGEESVEFEWNLDRALFGSRRFVRRYRERLLEPGSRSRIRCMVLLDMVGARDLQIDEDTNSDPELVGIFRTAARSCGYGHLFFRTRMTISDDHLPFLQAGIPAIDLIDLADNPQWHRPEDTLEHISPQTLGIVGRVVLTALPELERRYFPPPRPGAAPRLPEHR